jgi:hypothetical protein
MKTLAVMLIAVSGFLSGCIGYDPTRDGAYKNRSYDSESYNYYGNRERERDRDGDGVPNRQDRRPDDPRRY